MSQPDQPTSSTALNGTAVERRLNAAPDLLRRERSRFSVPSFVLGVIAVVTLGGLGVVPLVGLILGCVGCTGGTRKIGIAAVLINATALAGFILLVVLVLLGSLRDQLLGDRG